MIFLSATINNIHMKTEYDMVLENVHCVQPPTVKTNTIAIPGRDGDLDLTEYFGRIFYEKRPTTMIFGCGKDAARWPQIYSDILNKIHGKIGKIIFDDDPGYYWIGRISIDNYERMQKLGKLTISASVEPYKYEVSDSSGDWLWDSLDFEFGVIREYDNIKVDGTLDFAVVGTPMPVILEVESTANMKVYFKGKSYDIKKGMNKIYDIEIMEGEHILNFIGQGTITIHYRGGSL